MNIAEQLITEFNLQSFQIKNTLDLFDEGATIPFIARYRKERTGSLDEIIIRDLLHKYTYYKELDERRTAILESIKEQGKLTPELTKKIEATLSKTELEDLYLPYKPKRSTRATKAKDAGLEPLSRIITDTIDPAADLTALALQYRNVEKGYDTPQKALAGACDILAEELSDTAEIRKWMRDLAGSEGVITCEVKKEFAGQKTKYEMYYNFREPVKTLPSHRILAMLRGEREKVLRLSLIMPEATPVRYLVSHLIKYPKGAGKELLEKTALDSFERLIQPATETEIRKELREIAEKEAFNVFGSNLKALLLAPPAGRKAVLGIDPGFRTGCKVAAVDDTGKLIEHITIYPVEPHNKIDESGRIIRSLIDKFNIGLIAIGNGTASRETGDFIKNILATIESEHRPLQVIVSEAGASVYSASEVAIKEFPDLDLTVRGAISIARRLQDPLSELVKIDPKAIGVGQYQHDVNQTKLMESLDEVVESCVNNVGVDINLASEELLKYVSGLNRLIAANIVKFRHEHGAFKSRDELLNVPGLGNAKYQLSGGFLRIPGAKNPLDNTAVHPERYSLVAEMARALNVTIQELAGHPEVTAKLDRKKFVTEEVGLPTINDILHELEKPGRDPRAAFTYARFNDSVTKIDDLAEGMLLEGTVTNVTNFGAFVDIGVHQDGLVHISELADRYVSDPKEVVSAGQVVTVRVVKVDVELKRIALSMKKGTASGENSSIGTTKKAQPRPGTQQGTHKNPPTFKTCKPKFSIRRLMP